jgi:sterol O-acyltransferase
MAMGPIRIPDASLSGMFLYLWVKYCFNLTMMKQVMIMKMHSYLTVNGYLQNVSGHVEKTTKSLRTLVASVAGGWDAAIREAEANRARLDEKTQGSDEATSGTSAAPTPSNGSIPSTPGIQILEVDGTTKAVIDADAAATLRRRLVRAAADAEAGGDTPVRPMAQRHVTHSEPPPPRPTGRTDSGAGLADPHPRAPGVHPLVDHPDARVSEMARELSELEAELVSTGPRYVRWPDNIGWKNFAEYMLIPSLVYELEYPRTDRLVHPQNSRPILMEGHLGYAHFMCSRKQLRRSVHSHCSTL